MNPLEKKIIRAMLLSPIDTKNLVGYFEVEDFEMPICREIFRTFKSKGWSDTITICVKLKKSGICGSLNEAKDEIIRILE